MDTPRQNTKLMNTRILLPIATILLITGLCSCGSGPSDTTHTSSDLLSPIPPEDVLDSASITQFILLPDTIDMGTIAPDTALQLAIYISNPGSKPLHIHQISSASSHIRLLYCPDTILPSKQDSIFVAFSSVGLHGQQRHSLRLLTNTIPMENTISLLSKIQNP